MKKILFWLDCLRAYALPMSITAWSIPFAMGLKNGGNLLFGLLTLIGIICVHLGTNLFDDIIDYKNYLKKQKNNEIINIKKGKCRCFINNQITIKKALQVCALLFGIALIIGTYFIGIYKLPLIEIIIVTGILCLIYPKSGYFGLSEIIIGSIYSPLLFTGVYYAMTGSISNKLLWLSLSFALVTIMLLYTDFYFDFNNDKKESKKTIPIMTGSKKNAYYCYIFIIFMIYALLFLGIHSHLFSTKYFIIFISIIPALNTAKRLQHYINKEIKDEKEFLSAMLNVQKFITIFAILCVISIF